jgi:hypothetical protein
MSNAIDELYAELTADLDAEAERFATALADELKDAPDGPDIMDVLKASQDEPEAAPGPNPGPGPSDAPNGSQALETGSLRALLAGVLAAEIRKFNECHGADGKFCSSPGAGGAGRTSGGKTGMSRELTNLPSAFDGDKVDIQTLIRNGHRLDLRAQHHKETEEFNKKLDALDKQEKELSAKSEELAKKHREQEEAFWSVPPEQRTYAMYRERSATATELDATWGELASVRQQRQALLDGPEGRALYHKHLNSTLNPTGKVEAKHSDLKDEFRKESARAGMEFMTQMVGDAGRPPSERPSFEALDSGSRSYSSGTWVTLGENATTATVVHELGHWLEHTRPDVFNAASTFLHHRYSKSLPADRNIAALKDLTGIQAYGNDEVAFRDKFKSAYAGKIYSSTMHVSGKKYETIQATEIISVGMQQLYQNPVKFRREDKEYYNFILGVIHHVNRNKAGIGSRSIQPVPGTSIP